VVNRSALFAVVWTALAVAAWYAHIPIWFPFALVAAYQLYRAFNPSRLVAGERPVVFPEGAVLGELGRYTVDGDDSLGLFLMLRGSKVFVDLREDEHIEARKSHAQFLFKNSEALGSNLDAFRTRNPDFTARPITYIGLHALDVEQGEVFWNPNGYTILRGLEFVDP
jgi:hypothetical protein